MRVSSAEYAGGVLRTPDFCVHLPEDLAVHPVLSEVKIDLEEHLSSEVE
jgi:hypothetical protein